MRLRVLPYDWGRGKLWVALACRVVVVCCLQVGVCQTTASAWQVTAPAETPTTPPAVVPLSSEMLDSRLAEVEASTDLDEASKTQAKNLYQDARQQLESAQQAAQSRDQFQRLMDEAPQRLQAAQEALSRPATLPPPPPTSATLPELQQRLTEAEQQAVQAKDEVTRLNAEPSRRQTRLREIPEELAAAREQLAEIEIQLATAPPPGENPVITAARKAQQQAHRLALDAEIASFEKEQAAYAATSELIVTERDLARRQQTSADTLRNDLAQRIEQLRQTEAQNLSETARREAEQSLPALQPIAKATQELAVEAQVVSEQIRNADRRLKATQSLLEEVSSQFERTQEKVDSVGLTDALGILLRSNRDELAQSRQRYRTDPNRESVIRDAQLRLLELEDERSALADPETQLPKLRESTQEAWSEEIEAAALNLLVSRRTTLDTLIQNQRTWFETLVAMDSAEHELIEVIDQYTDYIEGHILWVRSAPPLGWNELQATTELTSTAISFQPIADVFVAFWQSIRQDGLLYLAFSAGFLLLLFQQGRFRRRITELGEIAGRPICQDLAPTIEATVATLGIAAFWPTLLWFLGWRLTQDAAANPLSVALAQGLIGTGFYLFLVEILRQVARRNGLGPAHLEWSQSISSTIRVHMRWLAMASVLVLLVTTMQHYHEQSYRQTLGRLTFIVLMLIIAATLQRWTRRQGALILIILRRNPDSPIRRYRLLVAFLLVGVPTGLSVLAVTGYYFTAYQLAGCLLETLYLLITLLLLYDLLLRSVLISHRRMAFEQRARRVAEQQHASTQTGAESPEAVPEVDLPELSGQTRQLIRVVLGIAALLGIWLIWTDFLPALGRFDDLVLWRVSVGARVEIVTLRHLLICLLTLFMTLVAVKNLPGLLELVFLNRLPLDAGARYAVATISRYLIGVLGIVIALNSIHVQWSQYGWLVAAATVGLGFGLQEIFANFVSGLIVLLERPIRIGDVVTVDGTTGVVSRIHMRATVVTNWDRQELVVPNKEFVTSKLLNWTLSNSTSRIVLEVGVAYGSDTKRVTEVLQQIVRDHPKVMSDPPPLVTFEALGESSLNYTIRAVVPALEDRLPTIHELNETIHRELAASGFEIPFPQRDLHVRNWPDWKPTSE